MVKSATRALRILKAIGESKNGMKHAEIASTLDIPKGSLSLILADLINEGFLFLDSSLMKYKIGPQILSLAGQYLLSLDIVKLSQPILRDLLEKTNESAGLAVRSGNEIMIVSKENSTEPIKYDLEIGVRYSIYSTAAGKAILANLDQEDIDEFFKTVSLEPKTANTIISKTVLKNQLKEIREKKYAYAGGEQFLGMIAFAAPVFNNERKVVASIVQPVPTIRFTPAKEQLIIETVKSASTQLSLSLGFLEG